MSVLIYKEDAIDTVEELNRKVNDGRENDTVCTSDVLRRINALPSADRPTGEWIPVSERLPEEYAQYLVCFKTGHCYVYWLEDSDWARGMVEKESIIAWMPLPMPYREDREEYELATEQMEHDAMYEPTYNSEDGSM